MQKETVLKGIIVVQAALSVVSAVSFKVVIAQQAKTIRKENDYITSLIGALVEYEPHVPTDVVLQVREKVQFDAIKREY